MHQSVLYQETLSGLAVIPGGRFFHLVGGIGKGRACRALIELYRKEWGAVSTAGIGDSLNDVPMLEFGSEPQRNGSNR